MNSQIKPIRVLAAGCYGAANVGDELLLMILNIWVRELGGELTVISLDPLYTSTRMELPAVSFFNIPEIALKMKSTDLFVMGGGGIFQDHYRFNIEEIYNPQAYEVSTFARPYYIARQFGIPTLIWAHGIGPLKSWDGQCVVKDIFSTATFASVRDQISADLLAGIGVTREVIVAPDPSWWILSSRDLFSREAPRINSNGKKKLGLIVRDWQNDTAWSRNLLEALNQTITSDWTCVWMGFQTVRDTYIAISDRPLLEKLATGLNEDISSVIMDNLLPQAAASLISQCDAVVAMRLHGAIISIAAGVPTISYEYDEKMGLAMEMARIPDHLRVGISAPAINLTEALRDVMGQNGATWHIPPTQLEILKNSALAHRDILAVAMREAKSKIGGQRWEGGNYEWLMSWHHSILNDRKMREATAQENQAIQKERDAALTDRDAAIALANSLINSTSWRLTGPVRSIVRVVKNMQSREGRQSIKQVFVRWYRLLPIPSPARELVSFIRHQVATKIVRSIRRYATSFDKFDLPLFRPIHREISKPDYILWGVIDWHFRHQRPQQLALALAATGHRVFYISSDLVDDDREGFRVESPSFEERVYQIKLFARGGPSIYQNAPSNGIVKQLRRGIGEVLDWADCFQVVSLVDHPYWLDVAAVIPNSRLIYDCMDHHEGFGNNADALLQLERRLLHDAELTITTSAWLEKAMQSEAKHIALIRNGCDYDYFSEIPKEIYQDPEGRRIIGYYGAIAEWFDVDLIKAVALQHPDACVMLIGSDTINAQSQLGNVTNIVFTGEVHYNRLSYYLHGFDLCLLPFKVMPLTQATNPVKVYEYLSAGKPVVSIDLPEMVQFENLIYVASGQESFLAMVKSVLSRSEPSSLIYERRIFAQGQTWHHRVEAMIEHAESCSRDPKVSIIVVSYNNLELTRACLASLDQHSQYPRMEVIVVDNASSDGTPQFLAAWAAESTDRKLILNHENLGFAAANNQGLEAADGDYLALLNNDTCVTPGWIRTLVHHLKRDPTIGLIGPVTNNIGNEAKIDISYSNMEEMHGKAFAYTRRHIGGQFRLRTAAFFCVMMPRTTYNLVGCLDEVFGLGFFEDDDYCRRIEKAGLEIVCAEDVFIHHHLSASFDKLTNGERSRLFDKNRAIYESKWGKWAPHVYRQH